MDGRGDLAQARRTAAVVAVSFLLAVLVYGAVAHLVRFLLPSFEGFARLPEREIWLLRQLAWVLAAGDVVLIHVLRGALLRQAASEAAAAGRLLRAAVVTCALAEVPAVLGFVLVILNGLFVDFFLLAGLSVLLLMAYFPRLPAWEEWARQRP